MLFLELTKGHQEGILLRMLFFWIANALAASLKLLTNLKIAKHAQKHTRINDLNLN
jgi:hypothetical protein